MARVSLTDDVLGEDDEPARPPTPPPATTRQSPVDQKPRKYTMLVSAEDDVTAHRVVDDVVARSGIRATKSMRGDVVRALLAEAEDDPALRDRVAARLRDTMPS